MRPAGVLVLCFAGGTVWEEQSGTFCWGQPWAGGGRASPQAPGGRRKPGREQILGGAGRDPENGLQVWAGADVLGLAAGAADVQEQRRAQRGPLPGSRQLGRKEPRFPPPQSEVPAGGALSCPEGSSGAHLRGHSQHPHPAARHPNKCALLG